MPSGKYNRAKDSVNKIHYTTHEIAADINVSEALVRRVVLDDGNGIVFNRGVASKITVPVSYLSKVVDIVLSLKGVRVVKKRRLPTLIVEKRQVLPRSRELALLVLKYETSQSRPERMRLKREMEKTLKSTVYMDL